MGSPSPEILGRRLGAVPYPKESSRGPRAVLVPKIWEQDHGESRGRMVRGSAGPEILCTELRADSRWQSFEVVLHPSTTNLRRRRPFCRCRRGRRFGAWIVRRGTTSFQRSFVLLGDHRRDGRASFPLLNTSPSQSSLSPNVSISIFSLTPFVNFSIIDIRLRKFRCKYHKTQRFIFNELCLVRCKCLESLDVLLTIEY